MLFQTIAVTLRVLKQIARDRRFLVLTMGMPFAVIYMLYVFFEGATNPMFDVNSFVLPVGAFLVHFLTYALCAIVLVRERSTHTLARMFVNGYRRISVILGYIAAYSVIATLQSLIVMVMLRLFFDLDYTFGTFAQLYGVTWLLAVISIALGILVSNFARNEGQVMPFIPAVLVPSVFFSGMIIAVENLPEWAQGFRLVTPLYYANETIREITVGGHEIMVGWLLLYGAIVLLLATFTLREQE